ncbi:hypothetical protein ANOM_000680 [Aspergillus nomiae NRRL 13137]|uniref:Berberine/berberine-like domain-containing protein n=1 Tax=Aspergillus nomiae NRRL (strain ATCC 15546 / NRRL 13137 / CBS 260.88 / M93) TaxID=1509407 RepID=A0A0L1JGU7_ASPN3|nr:uncharacterized protein ANOM_000680 [Aspergillus nomiae NRRL 13137]KNG90990.1 hypothetical protein ANOM_000680 [Aspergillus nomiae NRRL 13137]
MDIMASLPSVAAIVNGADLDPSNIPQVESLFAQFVSLSPAGKDDQRGSFVDRVFPLFGDHAVIDGSSAYEAQRQVPWTSIKPPRELTNVIQPISSMGIKQSKRLGGNPLGLEEVDQQWFLVVADWNDPADGDRVRQAMRRIVDAAEATAKANGTYLPYQYCNYAARDQDPLASYGAENVARLKAVASKYDPDGVFQTLQSGGWLLSRCSME